MANERSNPLISARNLVKRLSPRLTDEGAEDMVLSIVTMTVFEVVKATKAQKAGSSLTS